MIGIKELKSKILADINTKKLSIVLPDVIDFAEKTENSELKQLCFDELYGYEENATLPEYRNILVDFYDKFGEKITRYKKGGILSISEVMQKEYYPYRGTIESGVRSFIALKKPYSVKINNKSFEAHSFEHIPRQVKSSISSLKKSLTSQ